MATGTSPQTELDAVNTMLAAVFESPVNTLEVSGLEDVATAKRVLSDKVREVLLKGLANNVERNVLLSPDATTGKIPLPNNVLAVDAEPGENVDGVQRGGFLYDRKNHTFTFTAGVKCKVAYLLEFSDLPEYVKQPVTILAARRFQKHVLGSADKGVYDKDDEINALTLLGDNDSDVEDANFLTDSWSVGAILDR